MCDTGKAGVYCESELSYTIIESSKGLLVRTEVLASP